jgi:hypothetical protein
MRMDQQHSIAGPDDREHATISPIRSGRARSTRLTIQDGRRVVRLLQHRRRRAPQRMPGLLHPARRYGRRRRGLLGASKLGATDEHSARNRRRGRLCICDIAGPTHPPSWPAKDGARRAESDVSISLLSAEAVAQTTQELGESIGRQDHTSSRGRISPIYWDWTPRSGEQSPWSSHRHSSSAHLRRLRDSLRA